MSRTKSLLVAFGTLALGGCSGTRCPCPSSRPCERPCAPPTTLAVPAPSTPKQTAPLTLDRAIETALAAKPGLALEAGYEDETENGVKQTFVEVMVLDSTGAAIEVEVDPSTGRIQKAGPSDEADEAAELGAVAKGLPSGHLSLVDLVRRAALGGGTPVEAAFKAPSGSPAVCVVVVRSGAQSKRIGLDPVSGATRDVPQRAEEDDDEKDEHEGKEGKAAPGSR